jgi:hypothetical protein
LPNGRSSSVLQTGSSTQSQQPRPRSNLFYGEFARSHSG